MILDAYLFDVSRATTAATLLTCHSNVLADDCLDAEEKAEVCAAIERRFAALGACLKNTPEMGLPNGLEFQRQSSPRHPRRLAVQVSQAAIFNPRKGIIKSSFCGVETVSCVTGLPVDDLYELVESGNYLWVWNVSVGEGSRRELRFWCREINHPSTVLNLTLNGAIFGIIPRRARLEGRHGGLYYWELRNLLRLSKSTLKGMRPELDPVGSEGNLLIPLPNLQKFFRRRWLGNILIRNSALRPKFAPLLADKLCL